MSDELRRVRAPRNIKSVAARNALVEQLVNVIDARKLHHKRVSVAAGANSALVSNLRRGRVPSLATVQRLAGVLGYDLTLTPRNGAVPAAAWALRMNGDLVSVTLDRRVADGWAGKGWEIVKLTEEESAT